jgi:hypothetical protein
MWFIPFLFSIYGVSFGPLEFGYSATPVERKHY